MNEFTGKNKRGKDKNDDDTKDDSDNLSTGAFLRELEKRGKGDSTVSSLSSSVVAATSDAAEATAQNENEEAVKNDGTTAQSQPPPQEEDEFDGYAMRDVILEKWGECFDVEFQPVDTLGFREIYLNIMPFCLGMRRFRHETEYDYLCHLQAVVEILSKYQQLDYILYQIAETDKKPRAGTSPLIAVPLRLDLTPKQINDILRY